MKTQKNLVLLALLTLNLCFFSNCNTEDDASPDAQGQMSATVDGEAWESEMASASYLQGRLGLVGIASDGSSIIFSLDGFGVGQYNSSEGSLNALTWQETSGGLAYITTWENASGQVNIESINETDSLLSGTFQFTGILPTTGATVEVSDGIFNNIKYTAETTVVGDNFLKVKIDGALWEAQQVAGFVVSGKINLAATSADASKTVGLYIPETATAGTYDLGNPLLADYGAQYNADSQTFLVATSGTLKITSHDRTNKIIEGTFSFEAAEFVGSAAASLTEGSFYLAY
ncbi:MAG TPA: DUF6252 family protein [Saprospiraceae bacterium]|mgnify:CR=1 FL=1|nr:DUF6252 family protein [Saprospiraceae bacterium]